MSAAARPHRLAAAFALLLLGASCEKTTTPTEPTPTGGTTLPLERVTEHFVLRHGAESAGLMSTYGDALEASWPRITADLGVTPSGRIEGLFHRDQAAFVAATGYAGATGSVRGPNVFDVAALPLVPQTPVHEFAHCATLHLAPGIANNPVWLWEAVAVYEAGQLVPPSSLPSLVAGRFPTLAELSSRSGSPSIYDVGYTLTELIVARWGLDGLRRLIRSLGDLSTLGHTTASFEAEWRAFVTARYL